jgi:predicted amidohydrolase YtcJ
MTEKRRFPLFASLALLAAAMTVLISSGCAKSVEPADLVLMNAKIVTVDEALPEANWIAVRGETIADLGTKSGGYRRYVGDSTRVIDLEGALVIPGIIESHGHFTSLGASKMILDLTKAASWDDIVALVAEAAKTVKPGEWILGRGWHQDKWKEVPRPNVHGLPLHDGLSRVSPENPVLLTHASGHSLLANAKAMELAGITRKTTNPAGGEIIRDAKGNAIGAFLETAQSLLRYEAGHGELSPEEEEARNRKIVDLALAECLSHGVTTFYDAGSSFETIDLFKRIAAEGKLSVRLNVMLSEDNAALAKKGAAYRMVGAMNNHLTVRAIKRLIDGALGAHGAWLLEPYEDLPSSTGLNTYPVEDLKVTAEYAIENGFQLCVHAIGDRGNREVLDVYEGAFKAHPEKTDLRWRIEHAQHLSLDDIPRFGLLGVIPAMQGIHCTSDGPWVPKRLGQKRAAEGAYVWQKLMAGGAVIPNGTDVPVEPIDPLSCFYATVTRKTSDGSTFYPDQRMSRMEALRSYTANGAFAAFEEKIKGSLTPGKLADITVLSRDIMTCPEEEIRGTEVLHTIVGGEILYSKVR